VRADHSSAQSLPHGRLLPSLYRAREARDSAHAFRHVGLRKRVRAAIAPRRRPCQLILGAPFRPLGRKRAPGSVSARFRAGLPGARPACITARRCSTRLSASPGRGVTLLGEADPAPRGLSWSRTRPRRDARAGSATGLPPPFVTLTPRRALPAVRVATHRCRNTTRISSVDQTRVAATPGMGGAHAAGMVICVCLNKGQDTTLPPIGRCHRLTFWISGTA
jgi:hypothetical protein